VLYAIFHPTAREARRAAAEPAPEVVLLDPDVVLLEPADDLEEPQPPRAQHA
jgi:hypothetical protein